MYMMEAGSQTDELDTQTILNLLEEKSIELQQTTAEPNETENVIDETAKSSRNPKNEFQCENVSCTDTDGGLPSTSSPNKTSEKEKVDDFYKDPFSNTDESAASSRKKMQRKILLGRSHSFKGSSYSSSSTSKLFTDSFSRRASGGQSLIRASGNASGHGKLFQSGSCYGYPPTSSRARSSDKFRTNGAEPYIRRHISTTLSIPSRQASVRSCSSARSYNSDSKGNIKAPLSNTYNLNRHTANSASMKSLPYAGRASRSNSIFSVTGGIPLKDLPPKERRHKKVAYAVFFVSSFLLMVSVLCIIVSLQLSPRIDEEVRKENESLMSVIRPTEPSMNSSSTTPANGISSKETNSGGGIGGNGGSRTTTASSTELINENSLSNNNNEGPPISQSLIGGVLLQKRQFHSKTTMYPTVLNIFGLEDHAMAAKRERIRNV